MASPLPHATEVMRLVRRLASFAVVLTLCAGNLSVCAGWQASRDARMACCMNGASCPMHRTEPNRSGSKHAVTQAEADDCCAAAANRAQSLIAATFVLSGPAAVPRQLPVVATVPILALQTWRVLAPLPVPTVPKHLRHSVLLV